MNILILEDNTDDKLLLINYLKNTPLDFEYSHAPDKKSYLHLLRSEHFDLILSDYNIPGYDVEEAFTEARKIDHYIPFVIVSGVIEHEQAVRLVTELGISDFILKDNLKRLYDAITREIKSSETNRELDETQKRLREQNYRLRRAQKVAKLGDWAFDVKTGEITWSTELFHIYDRRVSEGPPSFDEMIGQYYQADEGYKLQQLVNKAINKAESYDLDLFVTTQKGIKCVHHIGTPEMDKDGVVTGLHGIIQDVSTQREMEVELSEKNKTIGVIADNINGVLLRYALFPDGTGKLLFITDAVEDIFGISKDEALRDDSLLWNRILDEDIKNMRASVLKAAQFKEDLDFVWRVRDNNNEIRHINGMGRPFEGENGEIIWNSLLLDVTEHYKLQENIIESEKRLDAAITGANLGIWDSNLLDETTIANNRWYEMLGYEPEEVPGPEALFALFIENIHPEDKPKIVEALDSIKEGEKQSFELILRVKNKSGDYFTILDKGQALEFDDNGKATHLIGTVLDITEQVQLENKLKESQFRLRMAVEGAKLGIWDSNIRDQTNIANERWYEMLGYSPEEVKEDSFTFFFSRVHPEDGKKIMDEIKAIEQGKKESFEEVVRVKHKSGEYITILDKGTALEFDEDGFVTRMIGTHLDITELVSTQRRLQRSLSEKELLIKEIHHRVKNNLAILAGLLELDIFTKGENPVLSDAISRIRSIGFVHELLYQTETMIDVDFKEYLNSYLKHIKKTYSIENIHIETEVLSGNINVNEAVPLGLLINELVTNSLKHGIPNGGNISIKLTNKDELENSHQFYYSDSGSGIDPEKLKKSTLGLELIKTLLSNLHADYELVTDKTFRLQAYFTPKERGAFGNPVKLEPNDEGSS